MYGAVGGGADVPHKKEGDGTFLSLGKEKTVRGYKIKQLPLGAYLKAAARLQDLPKEFAEKVFEGKSADDVLNGLSNIDAAEIGEIAARAFEFVPEMLIGVVSDLSGISADTLTNDANIGLAGFAEIIEAIAQVNDLGKVSGKVTAAIGGAAKKYLPKIGSRF